MGEEELILSLEELVEKEEDNKDENMEQRVREDNPFLQALVDEEKNLEEVHGENPVLQVILDEQHSLQNLVEEIERIIGYKFQDPILLQQAFTHQSFKEGCSSMERLAYLGDAILNFRVTMEQFYAYTCLDEGKLTEHRAINVDTEKLARAALNKELNKFLRHNIPLFSAQMEEFRNEMEKHPLHSCGLIDPPKILADMVESLIGAIFIDSNSSIDTSSKCIKNLLEPMISPESLPTHPVTQLHQACQKKKLSLEMRDSWQDNGQIEYVVSNGQFIGRATYSAKRVIAKNRAALNAYLQLINTTSIQNDDGNQVLLQ